MTISSAAEGWTAELQEAARRLLGREVTGVERIGGGRNSRVFRLRCDPPAAGDSAEAFVLKQYVRHPGDDRDRLATELGAFRFLWDHGVRSVPQPLAADAVLNVGIYEHVAGEAVTAEAIDGRAVDESVDFLGRLLELARLPESRRLGRASEACFSLQALLGSLDRRLDRLRPCPDEALQAFLRGAFLPVLEEVSAWCRTRIAALGGSASVELPLSHRTLSPSDFGFHNAVRRPDGSLAFVDFEYFGWDDPAKTLSDWLLHPGMRVPEGLKRRFVAAMLKRFGETGRLRDRVPIVYPLYGLKWCLILLNEFVAEDRWRRDFAGQPAGESSDAAHQRQLEKAEAMLERVRSECPDNPYV